MSPRKTKKKSPPETPGEDVRIAYYRQHAREYGRRYQDFHWPSMETLFNLIHTNDLIALHLSRKAASHGISRAALNVLVILDRSVEKELKHHEISRLLLVSRANVTGLVDSLCRLGLVERKATCTDRRACMARITPKGEKLLTTILPGYYKEIAQLLSCLKPQEKEKLNALLTRLRTELLSKTG